MRKIQLRKMHEDFIKEHFSPEARAKLIARLESPESVEDEACRRCHRALILEDSVKHGFGAICYRKLFGSKDSWRAWVETWNPFVKWDNSEQDIVQLTEYDIDLLDYYQQSNFKKKDAIADIALLKQLLLLLKHRRAYRAALFYHGRLLETWNEIIIDKCKNRLAKISIALKRFRREHRRIAKQPKFRDIRGFFPNVDLAII